MGFFKLGVLPIGVLEGITIDVRRPELLAPSLAQMDCWLAPSGAKRLELRRFQLLVGSSSTNSLEAARVRFGAHGAWELFDGVLFTSGTNQLQAARATLQVTGQQAGKIVLLTSPPTTVSFFSKPIPPAIHQDNPK
jgi:hypothetical protein